MKDNKVPVNQMKKAMVYRKFKKIINNDDQINNENEQLAGKLLASNKPNDWYTLRSLDSLSPSRKKYYEKSYLGKDKFCKGK